MTNKWGFNLHLKKKISVVYSSQKLRLLDTGKGNSNTYLAPKRTVQFLKKEKQVSYQIL